MKTVYLIVTDRSLEPDVIGVFETKELAIAALKERADQDVKCERAVKLIWRFHQIYFTLFALIERRSNILLN